jgi:nicotinamidase/pyrazinamidase
MHSASHALLVIDIQNDFCPRGKLAVDDGDAIVPGVNKLMAEFQTVVMTQDWHPEKHSSFASSHKDAEPFSLVDMPYGSQILWPDHCVQKSKGAEFHKDLKTDPANLIIRKGFRPEIDSYSAFFENDQETPTGLHGYCQERKIDRITMVGLATDYCVQYSALDAARLGYAVTVKEDLCRAIDLDGSLEQARTTMLSANVVLEG